MEMGKRIKFIKYCRGYFIKLREKRNEKKQLIKAQILKKELNI